MNDSSFTTVLIKRLRISITMEVRLTTNAQFTMQVPKLKKMIQSRYDHYYKTIANIIKLASRSNPFIAIG